MHKNSIFLAACLVAWGFTPGVTNAVTLTVYTTQATFVSATNATSAGALPAVSNTAYNSLDLGSVTIQAPRFFVVNWTTVIQGSEIGVSQGLGDVGGAVNDGINAVFDAPVDAAGFYFFEANLELGGLNIDGTPTNGCNKNPCVDSTYVVRVMNGSSQVGQDLSFNTPEAQLLFFGVASDTPFTALYIRETSGTDDNEYYGEFFARVASTAPPSVPEPGTLALLGVGLAGLELSRKRKAA